MARQWLRMCTIFVTVFVASASVVGFVHPATLVTAVSAANGNPDPSNVEYTAPDQVTVGETFEIRLAADNTGGTAGAYSTLTMSFPSFEEANDDSQFEIRNHDLNSKLARVSGESIVRKDGTTIDARYALAEASTGGSGSWGTNERHSLTVEVTPEETGTFTVYLRTTLADDSDSSRHTWPASGDTTDQQNFEVRKITVDVTEPTGDLEVDVEDETGGAADDASAILYDSGYNYIDRKQADSSGTVRWNDLSTGDYYVETYGESGAFWRSEQVTVSEGQTTRETVRRSEPYHATTVLTDQGDGDGRYEVGETVNIAPKIRNDEGASRSVRTRILVDTDGDQNAEASVVRGPRTIGRNGGTEFYGYDFEPSAAGEKQIRVVTETQVNDEWTKTGDTGWSRTFDAHSTTGSLDLTVLDEEGSTVGDATVHLWRGDYGSKIGQKTTDGSGDVGWQALQKGDYTVEVYGGESDAFWASEQVTVSEGRTTIETVKRSEPYHETTILTENGDGNGQYEVGETVTVEPKIRNDQGASRSVRTHIEVDTDGDGSADEAVTRGPLSVAADGGVEFYGYDFNPSTAGEKQVRVITETRVNNEWEKTGDTGWSKQFDVQVVPTEGSVTGTVTGPNGDPIDGAKVYLNDTTDTRTGSEGSYRFDAVPEGSYRIEVVAPGYDSVNTAVEVSAGKSTTQDFVLGGATSVDPSRTRTIVTRVNGAKTDGTPVASEFGQVSSLTIKVVGPEGTPVRGADVELSYIPDTQSASYTISEVSTGTFQFSSREFGIAGGTGYQYYNVSVMIDGERVTHTVSVPVNDVGDSLLTPVEGWRATTEIPVIVDEQRYTAVRMVRYDYDHEENAIRPGFTWLIYDSNGELVTDPTTVRHASQAATVSMHTRAEDRMESYLTEEYPGNLRYIVNTDKSLQMAKTVRDLSAETLGTITAAYATGGASVASKKATGTAAKLTAKQAVKRAAKQLAQDIFEQMRANGISFEDFVNDPMGTYERILRLQAHAEMLQSAAQAERAGRVLRRHPDDEPWSYQESKQLWTNYNESVRDGVLYSTARVERLPTGDERLKNQLSSIGKNFAEGSTGVPVTQLDSYRQFVTLLANGELGSGMDAALNKTAEVRLDLNNSRRSFDGRPVELAQQVADSGGQSAERGNTATHPPAEIKIVSPPSGSFVPNERVNTTVDVTNTGDVGGRFFVGYSVGTDTENGTAYYDNKGSTGRFVNLAPGETRTIELSWRVTGSVPLDAQYDVVAAVWAEAPSPTTKRYDDAQKVDAFRTEFAGSVDVIAFDAPQTTETGTVYPTATLKNNRPVNVRTALAIGDGGERIAETIVYVEPESTKTVTLEANLSQPGTHQLTISAGESDQTLTESVKVASGSQIITGCADIGVRINDHQFISPNELRLDLLTTRIQNDKAYKLSVDFATNDGRTSRWSFVRNDSTEEYTKVVTEAEAGVNFGNVTAITFHPYDCSRFADTEQVSFDPKPTPAFTPSATKVLQNESVQFDATNSTSGSGSIERYEWDFDGDGIADETTSSSTTTYTYASTGTHNVTLTIMNGQGQRDSLTRPISVVSELPSEPPTVPNDVALTSKGASATATSSGSYNGDDAVPEKAIDGRKGTEWGGQHGAGDALTIELARQYALDSIGVDLGYHTLTYDVEISPDGSNWTTVVGDQRTRGDHYVSENRSESRFDLSGQRAKYVRINVTSSNAPPNHLWQALIEEVRVQPEANATAFRDLSLNRTSVAEGRPVNVSATVSNAGATPDTYTAALRINGTIVTSETGRVEAGASERVTFTYTPTRTGTIAVRINDLPARSVRVTSQDVTPENATIDWSTGRLGRGVGPAVAVSDNNVSETVYYNSGALAHREHADGRWRETIISNDAQNYYYSSIAVDGSGDAHVVAASGQDGLIYARNGSAWNTSTLPPDGNGQTSITINPVTNRPEIVYYDDENRRLLYLARVDGGWATETIASLESPAIGVDIGVDADGSAHVAYVAGNHSVNYATRSEEGWTTTVVDDAGSYRGPQAVSLALTSIGTPHVVYGDTQRVRHAILAASGWRTETIATPTVQDDPSTARTPGITKVSVATDGRDRLHVAYSLTSEPRPWSTERDLRYAVLENDQWTTANVSGYLGDTGFELAITPNDDPVVIFGGNRTDDALMIARGDVPTNITGVTPNRTGGVDGNGPPAAEAGFDRRISEGEQIRLTGGNSTDPDGDQLTYNWTQIDGPTVRLLNQTGPRVRAVAPPTNTKRTLTFRVTVSDGNATATDTVGVTVTPTANESLTITAPANGTVHNGTLAVRYRSRNAGEVTPMIDGEVATDRTGPGDGVVELANVSEGNHTVTLSAPTDGVTISDTTTVTVDRSAPTVELTELTGTNTTAERVQTDGTVTIVANATDTHTSVESVAAVVESTSGPDRRTYVLRRGPNGWRNGIDLGGLPDGTYAVRLRATDAAGHVGTATAGTPVELDTTPPDVALTTDAVGEELSVRARASEPLSTSPVVTVAPPAGRPSNVSLAPGAHPGNWTTSIDASTAGTYEVSVTVTDPAGNARTTTVPVTKATVSTDNGTATVKGPSGVNVSIETADPATGQVSIVMQDTSPKPVPETLDGRSFVQIGLNRSLDRIQEGGTVRIPVGNVTNASDVRIHLYEEANDTWVPQATTVKTIDGTDYWVAEVPHYSTVGAMAPADETAPTLDGVSRTPTAQNGDYSADTDTVTTTFRYSDAGSGIDASGVVLRFDGTTVTSAEGADITSDYASYTATGLATSGTHTVAVDVADQAGNTATYTTEFTVAKTTATPAPPTTPTAEPNTLAGGGGGGGGGGGPTNFGGASASETEPIRPTHDDVTVSFGPSESTLVDEVSVEFAGDTAGGKTDVSVSKTTPGDVPAPSRTVTAVAQIAPPDEIESMGATISIRVRKEAFRSISVSPDQLVVQRFVPERGWQPLQTSRTITDENVVFTAPTPGFSTFAVATLPKNESTPTPTATATPASQSPTTRQPATTTPEPTSSDGPGMTPVTGLLALLAAVALLRGRPD